MTARYDCSGWAEVEVQIKSGAEVILAFFTECRFSGGWRLAPEGTIHWTSGTRQINISGGISN